MTSAAPVVNYGTLEAPFLVGVMASCSLYGIVWAQTIYYYRAYTKDGILIKSLVGLLLLLETVHQILATEAVYHLFVECKLPEKTIDVIYVRRTFAVSFSLTIVLTSIVQAFYAWRVWNLSRYRRSGKWVLACIAFLSIAQLGLGIADDSFLFINPLLSSVHGPNLSALYSSQLATAMACDILITLSLVFYLNKSRSGFRATEKVLDRLILFSVNIGLVTSLISVVCFATFHALPTTTHFTAFVEVVSKFYVNSALVTINSRKSFRKTIDEPDTFSLDTAALSEFLNQSQNGEPRPSPLVPHRDPSGSATPANGSVQR